MGGGGPLGPDYDYRPLDFSDFEFEQVSALLRRMFPRAPYLTPRYLQWQYGANPDGRAIGSNAWHEGRVVGHIGGLPLRALVEGEEQSGLLFVNGAIAPEHRGNKISKINTIRMCKEAFKRGYAFCIGIGNAMSTPALLTAFRMVAPLDAKLGWGVPKRRAPVADPSFVRLWSEEAMRWRVGNPERPYRVRTSGGSLAVTAPTGVPTLAAILYDGSNAWNLPAGGPGGQGPLRTWLGLDPDVDWRRSTFLDIPRRLRPSPLNLVYLDLATGNWAPDPARTIFRAIDFDPF
jgi:hypothetical protein